MRANTKKRKKATVMLKATQEQEWWADQVVQVMLHGKRALDAAMLDVGRLVAETLMYMEREERSGPDYHPTSSGLMKWASQRGSIYVGDQKLCVEHPRLRGPEGEVVLRTYEQLKNRGGFSEELLSKVLRGMSSRKYEETVTEAGKAFGVTPSSVSRHLVEATAKQLKQFRERSLEEFPVFAMYLDTVHRGGQAFVVALGVDRDGKKLPLGFWEGATENHEICEELLEELERRGLKLSKQVIWVTDGGGGIIKALKGRYGKKLIHQRCTLHKDRNIQRHLPKRYRKRAHHLFATALEQNSYKDAKKMLQEFERWLRGINESAADSLLEALEEVLTLHRLKVSTGRRARSFGGPRGATCYQSPTRWKRPSARRFTVCCGITLLGVHRIRCSRSPQGCVTGSIPTEPFSNPGVFWAVLLSRFQRSPYSPNGERA